MKKIQNRFIAIVTVLFLSIGMLHVPVQAEEEIIPPASNEIVVMHTNDMHGQMTTSEYELAKLKTYKNSVNPIAMFDGGDAFQGLPLNNSSKGKYMASIMNYIGYDANAVGNHEFDYSAEIAFGQEEGYRTEMTYPLVSSNTFKKGTDTPVFELGTVLNKEHNGQPFKISVVGATTPETYVKADPRHVVDVEFRDPTTSVIEELSKQTYADSDLYVVVAHLGVDLETKEEWRASYLAQKLSELPLLQGKRVLIIDGHSHTALPNGIAYGDNVLLAQTGSSLKNVGQITVNLDDFTQSKAELIPYKNNIQNLAVDPVIKGILDEAEEAFGNATKEIVYNNNTTDLEGRREFVRTQETNLGNLITDSMYNYAQATFIEPTDLAILNGGGIRSSIGVGDISLATLLSVLPYGNRVVQIDVTGADILAMYEYSLNAPIDTENLGPQGVPLLTSNPGFLHSSKSVKVYFDTNNDPGQRVLGIELLNQETGEYEALDVNKSYKLATIEFLAVGGDGFTMLGGARNEGANDLDVFADFFRSARDGSTTIDWSQYQVDALQSRVMPIKTEDYEAMQDEELNLDVSKLAQALENAQPYLTQKEAYTEASYLTFEEAYSNAQTIYKQVKGEEITTFALDTQAYTQAQIDDAALALENAIINLKSKDIVIVPEETETPNKQEKTVDTGVTSGMPLYTYGLLLAASLGTAFFIKRKETK